MYSFCAAVSMSLKETVVLGKETVILEGETLFDIQNGV